MGRTTEAARSGAGGIGATQADLGRAVAVAAMAHADQVDKAGNAYITHPIRVMQRCEADGLEAQIVGVLHDVVEDTWVTLAMLRDFGFSARIVDAVDAISQRKGETFFDYIRRCKEDSLAARVKLADLADNSSPARRFGPGFEAMCKHYAEARAIVEEALRGPAVPKAV